jgi:hypothetical protein
MAIHVSTYFMQGVDFLWIGTSRIHTLGLVADAPRVFDQHTSFWVIIRHKIKTELALPSCAIKSPQPK